MRKLILAVVIGAVFVVGLFVGMQSKPSNAVARSDAEAPAYNLIDIRNEVPVSLTLSIPGMDDDVIAPVVFQYSFTLEMRSREAATDTVVLEAVEDAPSFPNLQFDANGYTYVPNIPDENIAVAFDLQFGDFIDLRKNPTLSA